MVVPQLVDVVMFKNKILLNLHKRKGVLASRFLQIQKIGRVLMEKGRPLFYTFVYNMHYHNKIVCCRPPVWLGGGEGVQPLHGAAAPHPAEAGTVETEAGGAAAQAQPHPGCGLPGPVQQCLLGTI